MSSNSPPQTPGPPNRRRSSLAELFQPRSSTSSNGNTGNNAFSSAAASSSSNNSQPRQNNPRRVSVSTALGISGSPTNQGSAFGNFPRRRDSVSSSQESGSPINNEDALIEDNEGSAPQNTPVSPFARRVSFGAQAFGSVRSGGGSFSNEGFNWGDNLREKSTRPPPGPAANASALPAGPPQRSASIATMEPPKEMPAPQQRYKPDHLGERMLRGDFMMD